MNYSDFLKTLADLTLRDKLWNLFLQAESEAKEFSSPNNRWIEIRCVGEAKPGESGVWIPKPTDCPAEYAEIRVKPDDNDLGIIFHELFHSAFHESPLWKSDNRWNWGDPFCDAFRYFMEDRLLGRAPSEFLEQVMDYLSKTDEEITRVNEFAYKGRASRILLKCSGDYGQFKSLWEYLNQKSRLPLDEYFNLTPG